MLDDRPRRALGLKLQELVQLIVSSRVCRFGGRFSKRKSATDLGVWSIADGEDFGRWSEQADTPVLVETKRGYTLGVEDFLAPLELGKIVETRLVYVDE